MVSHRFVNIITSSLRNKSNNYGKQQNIKIFQNKNGMYGFSKQLKQGIHDLIFSKI